MPRIRTIKPALWDSESLGRLSCLARLTFIGMISLADDDGRGRAGARFLMGRIHTYAKDVDEAAIAQALQDLRRAGCVVLYDLDEVAYYYLPGWKSNQLINRPSPSILPPPPGYDEKDAPPPPPPGEDAPEPPLTPAGIEAPFLTFPVAANTGPAEWPLWSAKIIEYRLSFPGIDVEAECRRARQWCIDNPAGRKPYSGMASFLSRWLSSEFRKAQEKRDAAGKAVVDAKNAKRCERCSTRKPLSEKWPYCPECTWCSKDCGRSYPEHKSFRKKGESVVCSVCAEDEGGS